MTEKHTDRFDALPFGPVTRRAVSRGAEKLVRGVRRLDPLYRDFFDAHLQRPVADAVQYLIQKRYVTQHQEDRLALAQERVLPEEHETIERIAERMSAFLKAKYEDTGRIAERAGNTKTYGIVRGIFSVNPDLPQELCVGLFKKAEDFAAYVRFAGPGPFVTPDPLNNGILSMAVKLMAVPGAKLLPDEKKTVDLLTISSPTFTTPDIYANVNLQREVGRDTPAWYFLNPLDGHYLDALMQGIFSRTHANPLELRYFSCVPYLFGPQRAVKFCFTPRNPRKSSVLKLTDDYLREAMQDTLHEQEWLFDFGIQFQKDPVKMPIENASVEWPEKASPFVPIGTLRIPKQTFDYPDQLAFARKLMFNPWHTLPEHRPLGNQNRARKHIYVKTAALRQKINAEPHVEPTGEEQFGGSGQQTASPAVKKTA
jgi:hypothetical protein